MRRAVMWMVQETASRMVAWNLVGGGNSACCVPWRMPGRVHERRAWRVGMPNTRQQSRGLPVRVGLPILRQRMVLVNYYRCLV